MINGHASTDHLGYRDTVPTSKAKTAYGLLSDICKIVLAEPKRMRMHSWRTPPWELSASDVPSCGTVACIGGWTELLRSSVPAKETLGLTDKQADRLFFGKRCGDADQGTPAHARRVVSMIRRFQRTHAATLKRKAV